MAFDSSTRFLEYYDGSRAAHTVLHSNSTSLFKLFLIQANCSHSSIHTSQHQSMEPFKIGLRELAELNEDQQVSPSPPPFACSTLRAPSPYTPPSLNHPRIHLQTFQNVSRLRAGGGVSWLLKALLTDRDKGIATREVCTRSTSLARYLPFSARDKRLLSAKPLV